MYLELELKTQTKYEKLFLLGKVEYVYMKKNGFCCKFFRINLQDKTAYLLPLENANHNFQ